MQLSDWSIWDWCQGSTIPPYGYPPVGRPVRDIQGNATQGTDPEAWPAIGVIAPARNSDETVRVVYLGRCPSALTGLGFGAGDMVFEYDGDLYNRASAEAKFPLTENVNIVGFALSADDLWVQIQRLPRLNPSGLIY